MPADDATITDLKRALSSKLNNELIGNLEIFASGNPVLDENLMIKETSDAANKYYQLGASDEWANASVEDRKNILKKMFK